MRSRKKTQLKLAGHNRTCWWFSTSHVKKTKCRGNISYTRSYIYRVVFADRRQAINSRNQNCSLSVIRVQTDTRAAVTQNKTSTTVNYKFIFLFTEEHGVYINVVGKTVIMFSWNVVCWSPFNKDVGIWVCFMALISQFNYHLSLSSS